MNIIKYFLNNEVAETRMSETLYLEAEYLFPKRKTI